MENTYKDFNVRTGNRIMHLREKQHYTREYLAELSDISPKFLYEIETGKKGCSSYILYKIARSLDVNPAFLIQDKADIDLNNIGTVYNLFGDKQQKAVEDILRILFDILNEF